MYSMDWHNLKVTYEATKYKSREAKTTDLQMFYDVNINTFPHKEGGGLI